MLFRQDAGIEFDADRDVKVGKLEAAEATLEAAEATLEAVEATLEATDLDEIVAILKAADVLALQDGILAVLDDIPEKQERFR
ncbi:hypothetical protein EMCRGX_G030381 [Ephydatia muelleri]